MNEKLTLQELELLNTASAYNGEQHKAICGKAALELIEYKKIEEELGIDLITLKKLIFKGCYIKVKEKDSIKKASFEHINIPHLQLLRYKSYKLFNVPRYGNYYFKDYGKTWALTKEELE